MITKAQNEAIERIQVRRPPLRSAADEQLLLQQQGFSHYGPYSARAHEFGDGGQQVDGEYEQVNHRLDGSTMSRNSQDRPRRSVFVEIYEFAMDTINGLYKAQVIGRRGPWRSFEAVELATLEWADWFNNRRLLDPIGNIPPRKPRSAINYAMLKEPTMAARQKSNDLQQTRGGSYMVSIAQPIVLRF